MIKSIRHIAFFWLLLICGSQLMASDGDTAFLRNTRKIDVCDDAKKSVIITLDIGEISKADSLYGYNFRIDYDNEKIDFHTFLDLNTLTQNFQYKGANFFNSEGYLEGYAVNLTGTPVSGNKPLFGLFGDYIGDCHDTTYITVNYLDFTDEFVRKYEVFIDAEVIASVEDKEDRFLKAAFEVDTVSSFNDELKAEALIMLETNPGLRLESAMFEMSVTNSELYQLETVSSISEDVFINDVVNEDNVLKFRAFFNESFETQLAFKAELKQLDKTFETADLVCNIISVNECSCITRLFNDNAVVKGVEEDTSTSVVDFFEKGINSYYDKNNEVFIYETESIGIDFIEIYNLNGNLLDVNNKLLNRAVIDVSNYSIGTYILRSQLMNRKQYIKVLIKY